MGRFFALLARIWEVLVRRVDSYLMAAALAIVGIGLITLFSASDQNIARVTTQGLSLGFALLLMWVVANIQPQQLARAALPLYIVGVLLLVAVAGRWSTDRAAGSISALPAFSLPS
jgi:rod shape determining protein RodA